MVLLNTVCLSTLGLVNMKDEGRKNSMIETSLAHFCGHNFNLNLDSEMYLTMCTTLKSS